MSTGGFPRGLTLLLGIAAAVIAVAGMRATAWLIGPLFLALMIVIAAHPVQRWPRRKGWPTWAATLALIVVVYVGLLALAAVLVVSVGQLATVLPQYSAQFDAMVDVARADAGRVRGRARTRSRPPPRASASTRSRRRRRNPRRRLGPASVIVLILALLLFFIADAATFDKRLDSIAGDRPHIVGALDGLRPRHPQLPRRHRPCSA